MTSTAAPSPPLCAWVHDSASSAASSMEETNDDEQCSPSA
eukprot:CAMPEP_0170308658 /NCGR_PEP_ID=MMETSP0116_2-20130129/54775_1 /TAXON_ID=400756 /ORGANISM="Durinskia baltica, Strain CSIRO CS-38" /LENGTH=39 /DNA_ID= /DNA_START= /DNA_END= /DNA_ORIENTATION=